jgi:hypothetical protein
MVKLTQTEVETIKSLLDAHGELPRSFQDRLFPPEEQPEALDKHTTARSAERFAAAMADLAVDDTDLAALAKTTETHVWRVPRLWVLAHTLPVAFIPVAALLPHLDTAHWLGEDEPLTVRALVEQARRILRADLAYPIILSVDGSIMDGMHRLAKAWITDAETIAVVRFSDDPAPDYRIPHA